MCVPALQQHRLCLVPAVLNFLKDCFVDCVVLIRISAVIQNTKYIEIHTFFKVFSRNPSEA